MPALGLINPAPPTDDSGEDLINAGLIIKTIGVEEAGERVLGECCLLCNEMYFLNHTVNPIWPTVNFRVSNQI